MSDRIWRCHACRRTFDLARVVPQLQSAAGRPLTDAELADIPKGEWHTCPGPDAVLPPAPRQMATEYDWKTGKPR